MFLHLSSFLSSLFLSSLLRLSPYLFYLLYFPCFSFFFTFSVCPVCLLIIYLPHCLSSFLSFVPPLLFPCYSCFSFLLASSPLLSAHLLFLFFFSSSPYSSSFSHLSYPLISSSLHLCPFLSSCFSSPFVLMSLYLLTFHFVYGHVFISSLPLHYSRLPIPSDNFSSLTSALLYSTCFMSLFFSVPLSFHLTDSSSSIYTLHCFMEMFWWCQCCVFVWLHLWSEPYLLPLASFFSSLLSFLWM